MLGKGTVSEISVSEEKGYRTGLESDRNEEEEIKAREEGRSEMGEEKGQEAGERKMGGGGQEESGQLGKGEEI